MAAWVGQTYTCKAGDTFDFIALMAYGDEKYAELLMTRNPTLVGHMVFVGGEQLVIPPLENTDIENSTAPWRD